MTPSLRANTVPPLPQRSRGRSAGPAGQLWRAKFPEPLDSPPPSPLGQELFKPSTASELRSTADTSRPWVGKQARGPQRATASVDTRTRKTIPGADRRSLVRRQREEEAALTSRLGLGGEPALRAEHGLEGAEWRRLVWLGKPRRLFSKSRLRLAPCAHDMLLGDRHEQALCPPEDGMAMDSWAL